MNKCCFCIPVATGIKILGALDTLNWLASIAQGNTFQMGILTLPTLTFAMMIMKDTRMARKLFFATFSLYRVILLVLFAYKVYKDIFEEPVEDEQKAVANVCD